MSLTAWLVPTLVVVLTAGCGGQSNLGETKDYLPPDRVEAVREGVIVPHDAYLTWTNFTGRGDRNEAVYIWNGSELGKGKEGLEKVFQHMRGMREGARLLVYPVYPYPDEGSSGPFRGYPFDQQQGTFSEIARSNKLDLTFSPVDHNGKKLPVPNED
jgi:hypothetical protein